MKLIPYQDSASEYSIRGYEKITITKILDVINCGSVSYLIAKCDNSISIFKFDSNYISTPNNILNNAIGITLMYSKEFNNAEYVCGGFINKLYVCIKDGDKMYYYDDGFKEIDMFDGVIKKIKVSDNIYPGFISNGIYYYDGEIKSKVCDNIKIPIGEQEYEFNYVNCLYAANETYEYFVNTLKVADNMIMIHLIKSDKYYYTYHQINAIDTKYTNYINDNHFVVLDNNAAYIITLNGDSVDINYSTCDDYYLKIRDNATVSSNYDFIINELETQYQLVKLITTDISITTSNELFPLAEIQTSSPASNVLISSSNVFYVNNNYASIDDNVYVLMPKLSICSGYPDRTNYFNMPLTINNYCCANNDSELVLICINDLFIDPYLNGKTLTIEEAKQYELKGSSNNYVFSDFNIYDVNMKEVFANRNKRIINGISEIDGVVYVYYNNVSVDKITDTITTYSYTASAITDVIKYNNIIYTIVKSSNGVYRHELTNKTGKTLIYADDKMSNIINTLFKDGIFYILCEYNNEKQILYTTKLEFNEIANVAFLNIMSELINNIFVDIDVINNDYKIRLFYKYDKDDQPMIESYNIIKEDKRNILNRVIAISHNTSSSGHKYTKFNVINNKGKYSFRYSRITQG